MTHSTLLLPVTGVPVSKTSTPLFVSLPKFTEDVKNPEAMETLAVKNVIGGRLTIVR